MNDASPRPRLRPEIRISPFSSGTREETYLITCPDGRSLEINRRLRELMMFLDGETSCEEIAGHLSLAWQMPVTEEDVHTWVEQYLLSRDLLLQGDASPERAPRDGRKKKTIQGVPLIPARVLLPLTNRLCFLFRPPLSLALVWLSVLCHFVFYHGFLSGTTGPSSFEISSGVLVSGYLILLLSVLFHELGHLAACRHFRCTHGEIRFGLYLIFPVLYANVTAAWGLPRKARVVVDLGGVYFQLLLTLPLFVLHRCSPDPLWIFLVLELDGMILFALNPFLRFDGYWLCSDLLGVPNLRSRSSRLIRDFLGRITGRGAPSAHPFLKLRKAEFCGLVLYTVGSHVFIIGFFLLLLRFLPRRLAALPEQLNRAWSALSGPGLPDTSKDILGSLLPLLISLVLLFAAARMTFRFLNVFMRAIWKIRRRFTRTR